MYYPFMRGRQNELLCLMELLNNDMLTNITPVIEPVKYSKQFYDILCTFSKSEKRFVLVRNPSVGQFEKERINYLNSQQNSSLLRNIDANEYDTLRNGSNVISGYLCSMDFVKTLDVNHSGLNDAFVLNTSEDASEIYERSPVLQEASVTFLPHDEDFREIVNTKQVLFRDHFKKRKRNVDYQDIEDEFFSKDHLIFQKHGYIGFSDYSIVGAEYEESGFAPAAIAIHIVYFDKNNSLYVHHFVSDSNGSQKDPARKFQEAMEKLIQWNKNSNTTMTLGLKKLIDCYEEKRFPGLGIIKRYSMMHHLELMNNYLETKS